MKKKIFSLILSALMVVTMITSVPSFAVKAFADDGPIIKLHYHRDDNDYSNWSVWLWEQGHDGADYAFADEGGEKVATMNVTPGISSVGFIVRTPDWGKDIDADQFIDISEVVSGTVHIFVESKVAGYTKEYGDDISIGVKVKSAVYNHDSTITVTMTAEIPGDFSSAFAVKGKAGDVAISEITNDGNFTYTVKLAEELIDSKKYSISFEGTDYNVTIPSIYSTKEFEDKYTYTGNDLGATWTKDKTTFRVWAPTAEAVEVKLYTTGTQGSDDLIETLPMTASSNGTWVVEKSGDCNGIYYTYAVTIDGETKTAVDPYARTTGINGNRGMVIDLDSTDPEGWADDKNPHAGERITDAVIYEGHIRDLTVGSDTGITNKGKYLGLTEKGTTTKDGIPTGLDHIIDLGVTHLHILPMYDFGSVDETKSFNGVYNWGYDPVNYNVPEGSYSTDAKNGEVRVAEVKQMVKALHDNNISVVMDVVYNHVFNAEQFCFNVIVPGYFSRINADGSYSSGSGCGNDTASERSMVKKYIVDSVCYWADEYHIDGFRFDLVGLIDTETVNEIIAAVHATHPDVLFYGEGWSMSTSLTKEGYTLATQVNSEETPEFSYFNDNIRDGLKGSVFNTESGFVSGVLSKANQITDCYVGRASWCPSPSQTINYASCHDNNTLYDRLRLSNSKDTNEDIIKMNNLAAAIYITAEGTPFMSAGEEMLRTKTNNDGTFNSNSYNSGDSVNALDYASLASDEYNNVYEYYKGLIAFRKAHPVLRLATFDEVSQYVSNLSGLSEGVIGFEFAGGLEGESAEKILAYFNASTDAETITLPEGNWNVYVNSQKSGTTALESVKDTTTVEPISALILIKEDAVASTSTDTAVGKKANVKPGLLAGIGAAVLAAIGGTFALTRKKKTK